MDDTATGTAASQLVVVGASAGGVEALRTLVGGLPADFPAPIVVAQHLDPNRPSHLAEILASRSTLPVREVSGTLALKPGVVYVVPAGRDVEISDQHVALRQSSMAHSRPSVDRLLVTAARVFSENLIAVVLTGSGDDGAAGAQAVKAYGGTVVVQNPETARFSGMPQAVPPTAVDVVADIDAVGPLLADLLGGHYAFAAADGDGELRALLDRIREQTGLDFGAYKLPTIERRLQRRMAAVGAATLGDYRRHLERHPDELQRLAASFLIKVTQFFRDPELYDYLREHVLPQLVADARKRGELRLWSAGCATGEEAYTLAILVADLLGDDLGSLPVRIFATDVALDAIDFARRGVYPEAALTDLPADLVARHFVRLDGAYEVRKEVRGLVVFGEHDLGHRAPFPRIDLILCRNVLIYFTPALQRRALHLFAFSLRRGGYLVLGKAESVGPLPEYFALEQPGVKVFRRLEEEAPIPADRVLDFAPLAPLSARQAQRPPVRRLSPSPTSSASASDASRTVLDALSVGVVTTGQRYLIRTLNASARRLLRITGTGLGEDIVHAVPPALAIQLRAALDRARAGESSTAIHQLPEDIVEEGGSDLAITCSPLTVDDEAVIGVLVEVVDVTAFADVRRGLEGDRDRLRAEIGELRRLADEAVGELRELRVANRQLAGEMALLRAANEHLQVANEEGQAAAEEIETLNEELQATNEELETLNEELQATIEELTTTNDELQARSLEMQAMAAALDEQRQESEAERTQLSAVLATMRDAVLVVDPAGELVLANDAYVRLLGGGTAWVPEDDEGRPLPEDAWPQRRVARGETFTVEFSLLGSAGERRWFEANGQPVQGDSGMLWGLLVVRDISDRSLRRVQERFVAVAVHELRTPLTALSGRLQLLSRRLTSGSAEEGLRREAQRALDQSRRLGELIAELADVARLQASRLTLELAPVDIAAVARQAAETAEPLAGERPIVLEVADEPAIVEGDAGRLEQVVLNLLANAINHAPESDRTVVGVRREGETAVVEVRDRGPGIPADELPRVFDRFFQGGNGQSPARGMGLGLFIAREIVSAHGGTIEAISSPGEGTTFVVRLPLATPASNKEGPSRDPS